MTNDWNMVSINDLKSSSSGSIAIGPFGSRMKSDCYVASGVPVIRGTNITGSGGLDGDFVYITEEKADSLGSSNVYKGDLVFPHRGSIGEVGIVQGGSRFVISSSLMKLTCDQSKVIPEYLYYFFKSHLGKHELLKNASQVGTPGIGQPLASLKSIFVKIPHLSEQKAITHVLGCLDNKIELNRQINETLESMAQALFKSWFVDFDPVIDNALATSNAIPEVFVERAKQRAAAKKTDHQSDSTSAINDISNYQHLFPAEFEFTEEMGWIPLGWGVKSIEEALLINPRITLKKGSTAKFADMKALPTSGYSISEVIFKEYSGGAKFQKGDVLFARITPCLENGKTGIAYFLDDGEVGFGSTEFIVMRGKDGIDTPFVACLARDENFRIHAQQSMVGSSGRQRVQTACFSSYFLALPNDGVVIEQFQQMANPNFQKALKASKESETLTKLRDTLLPKLLSGELRIPDAEKLAQEALL